MASRWTGPGLLLLLGVGVWYLWTNQGDPHNLELDSQAFGQTYDPYAFWGHYRGGAFIRHYPDRVGQACLVRPLEMEDGAYGTRPGAAPYA